MTNNFGMRLRDLRENMELSQLEVAEKLNCSSKMISNYELSKRTPDFDILIKLCDLFNVTSDFLLGRVETPQFFHQSALTNDEIQLLKYFNQLPIQYKKDVLRYAELNVLDVKNTK